MPAPKLMSCGAVVVRETPSGTRLLMLRVFRHWDFPKGLMEKGESPHETMLREVREESSIADLTFPWGQDYIDTGPYNRGKVARYYLARTMQESVELLPSPDTGRPEHSEFRWVTFGQARKLGSPRVAAVVDWAEAKMGTIPFSQ
jgi:8-oxo-dGTP pyrophosphatase MutT (NUDIX family)